MEKFSLQPSKKQPSRKPEEVDLSKRRMLKMLGVVAATAALGLKMDAESKETKTNKGTFAERFKAAEQLKKDGVTGFQREVYKRGVSEPLARGLYPFGYGGDFMADAGLFLGSIMKGAVTDKNRERAEELKKIQEERKRDNPNYLPSGSPDDDYDAFVARLDAWRMYVGMPQEYGTFGISDFKPAVSKEDIYYYKLNRFQERLQWWGDLWAHKPEYAGKKSVQVLLDFIENGFGKRDFAGSSKRELSDDLEGVMGTYTLSKGQDESGHYISYWDRWDLGGSTEGTSGILGKPYEIYDRLYYDPGTYEFVKLPTGSVQ